MKLFIWALALLSGFAHGAASDVAVEQRNLTNNGWITRLMASPPSNGLLMYNTTSLLPQWVTVAGGLALTGSTLTGTEQADWASNSGTSRVLNRPSLAAVATSGQYADLTGQPTIPAAQVQTDWQAASGLGVLLNKPTTIAGYGLIDAASLSQLATKFDNPSGTTAQYLRGDGTTATFPTIPAAQVNSDWNAVSGVSQILNKPTLTSGTVTSVTAGTGLSGGVITSTGTISLPNTGTAGTYSDVTTDAQGRVTSGTVRTQASAVRSLNSAFQVNTTRDSWVSYSVQITVTASIAGGQNGEVILEIASNSGFTTNVQTLSIAGVGQTYTLAIALQGVQPQTGVVSGFVPAGYYARLRTVNNVGTPSYSYRAGQEALF